MNGLGTRWPNSGVAMLDVAQQPRHDPPPVERRPVGRRTPIMRLHHSTHDRTVRQRAVRAQVVDALPVRATPVAQGETRRESCIPAPKGRRPLHYSPRSRPPVHALAPMAPSSVDRTRCARTRPRIPVSWLPALSASRSSSWAERYVRRRVITSTPRVVRPHLECGSITPQKSRGASTPASSTAATSRARFSFWGSWLSP